MLKKLSVWFQEQFDPQQPQPEEHKVELATAVLLYEIMRADDTFEQAERDIYRQRLVSHFELPDPDIDELMELTTSHAHQAADFVQFTRIINSQCSGQEKRAILDSLWLLAYADNHLDPHEEHLIRRIADLLYIPHSQFIQSKLAAKPSGNSA